MTILVPLVQKYEKGKYKNMKKVIPIFSAYS